MKIESIGTILKSLNQGAAWRAQQEFDRLVKSWSEVVGATVSQYSRPLEIHDGVLKVSTSNSVWAQQLRFECPRILTKLNGQLSQPLREIQFSPARWHQSPVPHTALSSGSESIHPCRRSHRAEPGEMIDRPMPQTSQSAFQQWADKIQARSQGLPLCPQCLCPTPPGELHYWSVCALCAFKTNTGSQKC
jgi:predicted nucleic acid-binding Zn ribbon protein